MMRRMYWIGFTVMLIFLGSCQQEEDEQKMVDNLVSFQLRFQSESDTRTVVEVPHDLFWHIFDEKGQRVTYYKSMIKKESQSIFVEGLPDGEYSMVVAGRSSSVPDQKTRFLVPDKLSDLFIDFTAYQPTDKLPENIYYKVTRFTVVDGNKQQINIELQNVLARIDFNLQAVNPFLLSTITAVSVTLNEPTKAFMAADQTYLGERNMKEIDLTNNRTLFLLPTQSRTVSGTAVVTAKLINGELYTSKYNFNVKATEGEKSVVNIHYTNPEAGLGLLRLPRSYYTKANSLTMFKEGEAGEVLQDKNRRSFTVRTPLQLKVDKENKRLAMRFFSPTEIHDVKVYAKRCTDAEFFEILQLDNVPAFIETYLPLKLLTETVSYQTESGKQITITPPKEIVPSDYEFKVVCNDLFMQRVGKIRSNYRVCFSAGNPNEPEYSLPITPTQCRHGVAMMLNMCYLFGSDYFWEGLKKDKYYGDDGRLISMAEFNERLITNNQYIEFMRLRTKPGVAGGSMFGLSGYIIEEPHYFNSDYFGGGLYVIYHEFAHCLGYGHGSSMAGKNENMGRQGLFTTYLYYTVFKHFEQHNDMPIPYSTITKNVLNEF